MSVEMLPLSRLTVLDLCHARARPTAVRRLADWDANPIKIEPPCESKGDAAALSALFRPAAYATSPDPAKGGFTSGVRGQASGGYEQRITTQSMKSEHMRGPTGGGREPGETNQSHIGGARTIARQVAQRCGYARPLPEERSTI